MVLLLLPGLVIYTAMLAPTNPPGRETPVILTGATCVIFTMVALAVAASVD